MRGLMMVTVAGAFALAAVGPATGQQANPCAAKNPTGQKEQNPCAAKTRAGQTVQNPCAAKTPVAKNPCAAKAPAASPGAPSALRSPAERDSERP
jgi:hypothetical protein